MTTDQRFDFSSGDVPEEWREAAADAPSPDDGHVPAPSAVRIVPAADTLDLFTGGLAGLVAAFVGGYAWLSLYLSDTIRTPLVAVVVAVAIAFAVRIGGRADPMTRGMLGLFLYVATVVVVVYLSGRFEFMDMYGSTPDFVDFERDMIHRRIQDPLFPGALAAGIVAVLGVTTLTTRQ